VTEECIIYYVPLGAKIGESGREEGPEKSQEQMWISGT